MNFLANKYYKCWFINNSGKYIFCNYFKVKYVNNNTITTSWLIEYDNFYNIEDSFIDDGSCNYVEIELSEIVNFLPSNNSDKIIYLRKQRIYSLLKSV